LGPEIDSRAKILQTLRCLLVSTALAALTSACAQISDRTPLPHESKSALTEATRVHGAPMLAKKVREAAPQSVGKTILVEGFLVDFCDEHADAACRRGEGPFVIFSDDALTAPPGPRRQPCPSAGVLGGGVLVLGPLPSDFARHGNRRVVLEGTLSNQPVTVPIPTGRKLAGVMATLEFDLALQNVTPLALYDSRCD
jgi:hypothetical protein